MEFNTPIISTTEKFFPEKILRPWGWYENLNEGEGYKVKRLFVNARQSISLQKHFKRSEQWVVVKGYGIIQLGDSIQPAKLYDVFHIKVEEVHRLTGGDFGILIMEIQFGNECIEEDIERLEDNYGRV